VSYFASLAEILAPTNPSITNRSATHLMSSNPPTQEKAMIRRPSHNARVIEPTDRADRLAYALSLIVAGIAESEALERSQAYEASREADSMRLPL